MGEEALVSLASIIVLGIGAQWLAWRLQLPSILLLLIAGFFAGPVTGLIDPDHLLGETLFPIVSISVGIILFEGGLTLRIGEITGVRRVVFRLISIGALITWVVGTLGAYYVIGLDFELSLLIGAIFTVTGPTVVIPLLNFVRPRGQAGSILKWEGILIDPVGATLAVLVFEVVRTGEVEGTSAAVVTMGLVRTIISGGVVGLLAAYAMIQTFKRFWVPEQLQNPVAVMMIVAAFALSNEFQPESGLLATTLMGLILANQRAISVKHLSQFKEDIGILLLSSLFVILAARVELESLSNLSFRALVFVGLLIFVARPLAVYASTTGSKLTWRERVFLAWLAPRGIVAVSVASLFALELSNGGREGVEVLIPLTFLVVVGTVAIYGLTVKYVARYLDLAQADPEGVLIVGAHRWARQIARALQAAGRTVLLVDTNNDHVQQAEAEGLQAVYASILSDHILDEVDLSQMGRLLALTRNDEVNSLAALRFAEIFGRANVFQLPLHSSHQSRTGITHEQHGRCLFAPIATHTYLEQRFSNGAELVTVELKQAADVNTFRERYGPTAVPMFLIDTNNGVSIMATDIEQSPRAGQTMIALIDPEQVIA